MRHVTQNHATPAVENKPGGKAPPKNLPTNQRTSVGTGSGWHLSTRAHPLGALAVGFGLGLKFHPTGGGLAGSLGGLRSDRPGLLRQVSGAFGLRLLIG